MKISKRTVDALHSDPDGDRFVWDEELRGFGVRMMPSGAASYLIQYRTPHGRTRRLAIGKIGTLTPDEARKLARARLSEVAEGKDPSAERHSLRKAITVSDLCDTYLNDAASWVKSSTLAMDRSRVQCHVKPLLGRRAAATLTLEEIQRFQADVAAGKSARAPKLDEGGKRRGRGGVTRGGKGVATRTVGMLGTILEYARKRKIIAENPVRGVERLREGKQQRFLSSAELRQFGRALAAAPTESPVALSAIKLILLTGLRRMEALALKKPWLDQAVQCIRFPDTKSGAQLRVIGVSAIASVKERLAQGDPEWLFPADHGAGHFVGLPKVLARICSAAELEGITVHVLRHTFAAVAAELGYSQFVIAGLLGHSLPGVTARYAHMPDTALVAAADRISERIVLLLSGEGDKRRKVSRRRPAADVIDLEKRRRAAGGVRGAAHA
jgi:site-specific recombinase XerD